MFLQCLIFIPTTSNKAALVCLKTLEHKFASGCDLIFQDKTSFNVYCGVINS